MTVLQDEELPMRLHWYRLLNLIGLRLQVMSLESGCTTVVGR